ncbi:MULTISPECIES: hypothetical protein [unclassified Leptolyngbya]|uniref:hypothetical protein n=1 Tax=unclassified Leptolyngbya TaxID=2650499 RepID=UPI00168A1E02|nr:MULTISPECIES: hypothetical protein [unclassified Leptolyngbya]MBD1910131.1 hypothetical protein [Leptolyngbya sp. FACHB-8]MBD2153563.1 hypothetical protein [Leptolyngbya sp. FACHB-16]
MFMIDVVLKNTPSILSVQRKAAEDAEAVYKQITEAIANGNPKVLELTCEKEASKRITMVVSEVIAVQVSDKAGAGSTSGRAPGFFALTAGE